MYDMSLCLQLGNNGFTSKSAVDFLTSIVANPGALQYVNLEVSE